VVGRRELSQGLFLDRRAFLVSYDPSIDPSGVVLERTLAAVGPVGAGINLEYFFSTVDGERLGSGTKLPHNVTGLFGVMNGAASDLRTGLPKQMTEIHEPVRLHLIVEATPEMLTEICRRQPAVAELVMGEWVRLAAVHPETRQIFTFDARTGSSRTRRRTRSCRVSAARATGTRDTPTSCSRRGSLIDRGGAMLELDQAYLFVALTPVWPLLGALLVALLLLPRAAAGGAAGVLGRPGRAVAEPGGGARRGGAACGAAGRWITAWATGTTRRTSASRWCSCSTGCRRRCRCWWRCCC
jgi:hypothetical protein